MEETQSLNITNQAYVDELYELWNEDPSSVSAEWRDFFEGIENGRARGAGRVSWEIPRAPGSAYQGIVKGFSSSGAPAVPDHAADRGAIAPARTAAEGPESEGIDETQYVYKQTRVDSLLWAYRDVGYIHAETNPLDGYITPDLKYMRYAIEGNYESLSLKEFDLHEEDLDKEFYAGRYMRLERAPLRELVAQFESTYCGTMGVEILHIQNKPMRRWLIERIEDPQRGLDMTPELKRMLQTDLMRAEEFEHFIHSNFIGQKRFSLEGCEVLIPALHYLVKSAAEHHMQEIVLGMAHRGRLNVLVNALNKPAVDTFANFIDNYQPHSFGGSGDVKYHLGHSFDYEAENGQKIHISLVANPSHLEAVDPVVEGKARGIQRRRGDRHRKRVMPVLIHGDAAFSGQGVVAETFNLSQLKGYKTGGTVHIILNNQIGFTTASRDARSTFYTSDVAKGIQVPIFHVNGDDPEAVIRAVDLAIRYRQKFGYDAIVDIVGYRRLGHNEADEPSFTHPKMYELIKNHPTAPEIYGKRLAENEVFPADAQERAKKEYLGILKNELKRARDGYVPDINDAFQQGDWNTITSDFTFDQLNTSVDADRLAHIGKVLTSVPEDFHLHPKLKRFIQGRRKALDSGEGIDWALAEALSWGSLLMEGFPIRLSGEDSGRGTFSQRHAVWWDVEAAIPRTHMPLRHLSEKQGWCSIYDSPLSEYGVLGFDYGYSIAQPNILVMWEAQFGDFVNGGQVVIDQFIAAGERKWFRASGLVMLLPHGYEGQGPEHSSAHLERFLQLCAEDNMQVMNLTTPAQYFHVFRRQMWQSFRKPLIIMTPKSLLRHKRCVSRLEDLSESSFHFVLDDPAAPKNVENLLICSGKVYYDLVEERERRGDDRTAIVRIEQLYPRPTEAAREVLGRYEKARSVRWVQEESRNRGGWSFVHEWLSDLIDRPRIEYVGRPASASPASGSHQEHKAQLEEFLEQAFKREQ